MGEQSEQEKEMREASFRSVRLHIFTIVTRSRMEGNLQVSLYDRTSALLFSIEIKDILDHSNIFDFNIFTDLKKTKLKDLYNTSQ